MCYSLKTAVLPKNITVLPAWTFCHCTSLTSLEIPDKVAKIEDSALDSCINLTSVTIPNSVKEMEDSVFFCCRSLTSLSLPNALQTIGNYVWDSCEALGGAVTLPNTLTAIGDNVFNKCASLKDIYSYITDPASVKLGADAFHTVKSASVLHIPNGTANQYKTADQWKDFAKISEDISTGLRQTAIDQQETDDSYYSLDGMHINRIEKDRLYIHKGKVVSVHK